MDYFRNEGLVSDTATVLSFRMAQVPLPEHMKITSIDTAGLLLTWNLREPSAVYGVVIERGPKIDSGFVELYTAAPTDTSFLDMSVTPMTRYYYQLRLIGPGGLRSPSSAVVIGIYKSSDVPAPPYGVHAEGIENGVRVSWFIDTVQYIDGYFVFRSDGEGMPLRQISSIIPTMQTSYVDTSLGLDGTREYYYAVVSENSSHVRSSLSDTVAALPLIMVPVTSPRGLVARVTQGQVALFWDAQQDREITCAGFRVYRKEGTDDRWTALTDTLLEGWQNYFTDEKTKPGGRYTYAVRAFNIHGDSSALSFSVKAGIDMPEVYPPANLTAQPQGRIVTLRWDEIAQPGAKEFRLYRYTRGAKPALVKTLSLDVIGYTDEIKGRESPVFYYLTTVGQEGQESRAGKEVAVMVK
jgi:fibronectin type 3 domain-containing protein